jgi:hypothetical protein
MIYILNDNYNIHNYVYSLVKPKYTKYKKAIDRGYKVDDIPVFSINRKINKVIEIKI